MNLYVFGDSYAEFSPNGWLDRWQRKNANSKVHCYAMGGSAIEHAENQMWKYGVRKRLKNSNDIGMFFVSSPYRMWLDCHIDTTIHGNDSKQLKERRKIQPKSQEQLDHLKRNNIVKYYDGAYYFVAWDTQRHLRDMHRTFCSIDYHAKNYSQFFVFFCFEDALRTYKRLEQTSWKNINVVDNFAFDKIAQDPKRPGNILPFFRDAPNHMNEHQNRTFAYTLDSSIKNKKFDYTLFDAFWERYDYTYNESRE